MFKIIKKNIMGMMFFLLVIVLLFLFFYFFVGKAPRPQKINWGVDFSQMHTEHLGLNWKEVYLAILDDLKAKNLKLHTQWDFVEGERNKYYFEDIDWQIREAEKRDVKIIFVLGMKTGRWPECHIPSWAKDLSKEEQQKEILEYIKNVVERYKNSKSILYWQVENEPLFKFGHCPWYDKNFLDQEVALVKSLDPERKIVISDSGEQSLWWQAAKRGDIVGTTLYRKVWFHINEVFGFYVNIYLPPVHYWRKAQIIDKFFGKKVICIELQAEPWAQKVLYETNLEEQKKSMNINHFRKNVEYAKKTGLDTFYFWGVEWWYLMKEKYSESEIWEEAKKIFSEN